MWYISSVDSVSRSRYLLFHTFQRDPVFSILVSLEESLNELFQYVNIP
jgi:hypothetical protein